MDIYKGPRSLEEVDELTIEDISYLDSNPNNSNTNLVLIHCFAGDRTKFQNILHDLTNNYRVITYDLLAHGKSKILKDCSYSLKDCAYHLKILLDHLQIKKSHILGHSLGGKIALEFLNEYPSMVSSVIVEDMNVTASKEKYLDLELIPLRKLLELGITKYETMTAFESTFKEIGLGPRYNFQVENINNKYLITFCPKVYIRYLEALKVDQTETVKKAKCPILFLVSEQNEILPSEFRKEMLEYWHQEFDDLINLKLPHVIVKKIPGSNHFIHISNEKEFVEIVCKFIQ